MTKELCTWCQEPVGACVCTESQVIARERAHAKAHPFTAEDAAAFHDAATAAMARSPGGSPSALLARATVRDPDVLHDRIDELNQRIEEKDKALVKNIVAKGERIGELNKSIAEHEKYVTHMDDTVKDYMIKVNNLMVLLRDRNHTISLLRAKNERLNRRITKVRESHDPAFVKRIIWDDMFKYWLDEFLTNYGDMREALKTKDSRLYRYFTELQPGLNYHWAEWKRRKGK